jgi:hypothetical protein
MRSGLMTKGRRLPVQSAALALIVLAGACAEQAPEPSAQRTEPTAEPTVTLTPLEPVASPKAGTPPGIFVGFQPVGQGEPLGRLVLVEAATGDVARVLLDDVDYSEGGIWSPDLAPDWRTLYYSMGTSACTDDVRRLPLDDGDEEVLAAGRARGPALSPDGRLLAYLYGDFCVGKTQYVVVRELASGHETRWRFRLGTSGAEGVSLRRLVWLPDSRTLAYEVGHDEASWIHLLDTDGDEGIELGEGPRLGPQDSSLELVGFHAEGLAVVRRCLIPSEPECPSEPEIVALDPETGEVIGTLLRPAPEAFSYDLDPSGRHLLYITEEGLFRWSGGESVRIGGRYFAATW